VGFGADHLGCFGVGQRLEHQLHRTSNDIEITASANRVEQIANIRIREGHRRVSFT
jgi:hypothetical protein